MKIGLIDVDSHHFPNLALMKISAYHKARGDTVDWWWSGFERYDIVYKSRVFDDTYSADHVESINADLVIAGGTGYDLRNQLPDKIEHQYPDYSIYLDYPCAYGFLTRGCPKNCPFCIVGKKEGLVSCQVAEPSEFWRGQNKIKLLDPNLLACKDHEKILIGLAGISTAVDFTQGLDARLLNKDNARLLKSIRTKRYHFAWDREKDTERVLAGLRLLPDSGISPWRIVVYVLTNFDTDFDFDLYRVNTLRNMGMGPYVMMYDKGKFVRPDGRLKPMRELAQIFTAAQIEHFKKVWKLQGWANNRLIWSQCNRFEDYKRRVSNA